MKKVLVAYLSRTGKTEKMAEYIAEGIRFTGNTADLRKIFEIKNETIRDSLKNFAGLEHRMEHVSNVRGVSFVNDSKATNVNSPSGRKYIESASSITVGCIPTFGGRFTKATSCVHVSSGISTPTNFPMRLANVPAQLTTIGASNDPLPESTP